MSDQEQFAAMGKAVAEYAEAKTKLAALHSEVRRVADDVRRVLFYIGPQDNYSNVSIYRGSKPPSLESFPSAQSLSTLIADVLATQSRKAELHQTLKEFGSEPKD